MTQEEKIKEAKRLYKSANADQRYVLESLFPELKESEGEKTKRLLHTIANKMSQHLCDIFTEEEFQCFDAWSNAWLENQGEQKPADKVEPKFKVGDVVTNKKSKDTVKIVQILHDSYCYSGWDGAATVHSDFSISEQDGWELVEQNPAWSEEYEKTRKKIIKFLEEQNYFDGKANEFKKPYEKEYEWLKSLKERVQPMQELSEEDECIVTELIGIFESAVDGGHVSFPYRLIKDYIRVLKSCLSQSTWKPSDDEMKALAEALSLANNCGEEYAFDLRTLQDQLKKLK